MKITRKEYEQYMRFQLKINRARLENIDFSEFFVINNNFKDARDRFALIGMNNLDFISCDVADRNGVERKFDPSYLWEK